MAKNSKKQIKKDEKKIINELSKNSNKSINKIAKSCNFSRQKVWRIIKNLEKNDTIWGYTAVINEEKLDKKGYFVLIKRTNQPITKNLLNAIIERKMEEKAKKTDVQIISSNYTNGAFDWVICFEADNIKNAKRFCEGLAKEFSGFLKELHLLDKMFSVKKCGIHNPNVGNLADMFDV